MLAAAGTPESSQPGAFTLAASGHSTAGMHPTPMSIVLASRMTAVAAMAGPQGFGVIEDNLRYNTAVGWNALYSNANGSYNTASGAEALYSNTPSSGNTASGYQALYSNRNFWNTASGYKALYSNVNGSYNTSSGAEALYSNSWGEYNTASGAGALWYNTNGGFNTASGVQALYSNDNGRYNTASGYWALFSNMTGSYNTAIGFLTGDYCQNGNYNIYLGSEVRGEADDKNTIRIGTPYNESGNGEDPFPSGQNRTFIAGIAETGLAAGDAVGVTPDGQLGTLPASLVSGSLLFLATGFTPPPGYTRLGSVSLLVATGKRPVPMTFHLYMKQ